ncbi:MAG: 3-hydroxyacyl-CoA dehydrogenase NAD-binding domain-containing protein [Spirochaetaceae bacterium]|nr:3-hydroxyacyl-CoA dehydrogenase NAD-binding domain-containing protein [Spirochaetaceae bacterium]
MTTRNSAAAIERVAVIGAGLMGHGIALEFAVAGRRVAITDASAAALEQGLANMRRGADTLAGLGLAPRAACASAMQQVTAHASLAEAVAGADLVIEAVSEDLPLKRRVFAELDRACGAEVVLASNTSTFMPSALAAGARHPERILVAHYFNPPHLLPVVEIVPHLGTAAGVVTRVRTLYEALGKRPVVLQREIAGFIANRLQQALLREAVALVEGGVAGAADVDAVVSGSFGRRLAVAGPFEVSDLAGLDVIAAIARELWPDLAAGGVADLLADPAAAGDYGAKTGRGFGDWPPERVDAARQRIATALAAIAAFPATAE